MYQDTQENKIITNSTADAKVINDAEVTKKAQEEFQVKMQHHSEVQQLIDKQTLNHKQGIEDINNKILLCNEVIAYVDMLEATEKISTLTGVKYEHNKNFITLPRLLQAVV